MLSRDAGLWAAGIGALGVAGISSSVFLYQHLRSSFLISSSSFGKPGKGVLVTGCDSGIGQATVLRLSKAWPHLQIFAGCYSSRGVKFLRAWHHDAHNAGMNITPFVMDVTNQESIAKAVKLVENQLGSGNLLAVVNNAGVYDGYYVEFTPVEVFKNVMEVAFFGVVAVTKAFLPMLVESKGRVINITSLAAVFPTPTNAAYSAAKYAVAAFSAALRAEVGHQGVQVIQVVPSAVRTPSLESIPKCFLRLGGDADARVVNRYGGPNHTRYCAALMKDYVQGACDPEVIAKVIERAIRSSFPKAFYYAGPGSRFPVPISMLPQFVIDCLLWNPIKKVDRLIRVEEDS